MAKAVTDLPVDTSVIASDMMLITDVTNNVSKSVKVSQLRPTTFYVDGSDIAPVNQTGPTDVPGSSATFTVDVQSYMIITFGALQQRNVADSQSLILNIDGTGNKSVSARSGSGITIFDTSRAYRASLAPGSHTIKLQYACNSTGNGVMSSIYWTGILVAQ